MIYPAKSSNDLGVVLLKIGFTGNLARRIKQYKTCNPLVEFIAVIYGDYWIEGLLHNKFRGLSYQNSREWFKYSSDIIEEFKTRPGYLDLCNIREAEIRSLPAKEAQWKKRYNSLTYKDICTMQYKAREALVGHKEDYLVVSDTYIEWCALYNPRKFREVGEKAKKGTLMNAINNWKERHQHIFSPDRVLEDAEVSLLSIEDIMKITKAYEKLLEKRSGQGYISHALGE